MSEIDRRLAPTFASQLALITRTQALAAGMSPSGITRRLASGAWEVTERGVYALTGVAWTWRRHLGALVLSIPTAVASHRAAAALLGVERDLRGDPPLEFTVPTDGTPERPFAFSEERAPHLRIVLHESIDLHHVRRVFVDGIPTTPVDRLSVDLGSVVGFDSYRRAMAGLRRDGRLDWPTLEATYRRYSARGRNGCGALHELLDRHYGQVGAPSEVVEMRCSDLLVRAGLPAPVHQHVVHRPDGRTAVLDLAYPEWRIGIETEGGVHDDPLVRQRDHERRNNVQLVGWTLFHFTWEDVVHRPDYVIGVVRSALQAVGALPA